MFRVTLTGMWGGYTGGWFNKKMPSYQYRKSHCGDKAVISPSSLHNGISYTGKITCLYWIRALVSSVQASMWPSNFQLRGKIPYQGGLYQFECWGWPQGNKIFKRLIILMSIYFGINGTEIYTYLEWCCVHSTGRSAYFHIYDSFPVQAVMVEWTLETPRSGGYHLADIGNYYTGTLSCSQVSATQSKTQHL